MKERSSFRERAKFSQRILCSSWRILGYPMPNEHPGSSAIILCSLRTVRFKMTNSVVMIICMTGISVVQHCTPSGGLMLPPAPPPPGPGSLLCSWARHFTLTVPLSTQEYKWVPANFHGNLTKCWGLTLQWYLVSNLGGVVIRLNLFMLTKP